jgi:nucleoside-diphosphate-sugar epimerase
MRGRVCVAGATSQLGVFLLPRLRAAGCAVVALSRRAPDAPQSFVDGLTWMRAEAIRATEVETGCLVSCGPLALAGRLVACLPGLERVIAFSSSSVQSKADSADAAERAAMASLAAAESALAARCAERNLPLLLLRPTLIYGCGLDRNVSLLAAVARRFGVIPLAGAAGGRRQPVHADDLAELAVRALLATEPIGLTAPVCGADTITYREMARRIATAVPRRVRLLTLPEPVLAGAVRILPPFGRRRGLNAEMVRRQNRDLVFDDSALRRALDWSPRPFEPTAADFEVPQYARSLQLPDSQP